MASIVQLGTLAVKIDGNTKSLRKGVDKATATLRRMSNQAVATGKAFSKVGKRMTLALTVPIAGLAVTSAKFFTDFDEGMRNVNTIAKQSEAQFAATSQKVLDMSVALGRSPKDMANALFNINSASFQAEEGLTVLRESAKAGVAGLADTATAAKAITAVLNAYGKSASEAGDVSDILFKTLELGVLTFPELAANLGTAVATASTAKVPFAEVAAAIATMTKGGIESAEAFTSINRFMQRFITGGPELDKVFRNIGFESASAALEARGLGFAVKTIQEVTGGSAKAITNLGFAVREFKAAASLTRDEGRAFAADLVAIADKSNRAGATQAAFNEQTKALAFEIAKTKSELAVMAIEIGSTLVPIIRAATGKIREFVNWWKALSDGQRKAAIQTALVVAAIGPLSIIVGRLVVVFGKLIPVMGSIIPLFVRLGSAIKLIKISSLVGGFASLRTAIVGFKITNVLTGMKALRASIAAISVSTGAMAVVVLATTAALIGLSRAVIGAREARELELDTAERVLLVQKRINEKFGGALAIRKELKRRQSADLLAETKVLGILKTNLSFQEKIKRVQALAAGGVSVDAQTRLAKQIEILKAQLRSSTAGTAGRMFIQGAEDKAAQAKLEKAQRDFVFERMNFEQRIMVLRQEEFKLAKKVQLEQKGTAAAFEAQLTLFTKQKEIQAQVADKVVKLREEQEAIAQSNIFAGAAERGTVEAFRASIRGEKRDIIAKLTKTMSEDIKELITVSKDELAALQEISEEAGVEIFTIL